MKKIFFVLGISISVMVSSCSPKYGCGGNERDIQKHDRKPFRVMRIKHDKKKDIYYVYAWRGNNQKTLPFRCVPQSVELGAYISDSLMNEYLKSVVQ